MKIGNLRELVVKWVDTIHVKEGDCFTIKEGDVHQLINDTDNPLQAVFSCPATHLSMDRFFIK